MALSSANGSRGFLGRFLKADRVVILKEVEEERRLAAQ